MNYVVRSTDALLPITIHGGPRLVNFNDWLAHCNSQRNLVEGKRWIADSQPWLWVQVFSIV